MKKQTNRVCVSFIGSICSPAVPLLTVLTSVVIRESSVVQAFVALYKSHLRFAWLHLAHFLSNLCPIKSPHRFLNALKMEIKTGAAGGVRPPKHL